MSNPWPGVPARCRFRPIFEWPGHVGRPQAHLRGSSEIAAVRRNHHDLGWIQPQKLGRSAIHLAVRLVRPGKLRGEHGVPGQTGVLCHVDEQGDVAVRQRCEDVSSAKAGQTRDRVGPRAQPMPHAVQIIQVVLGETFQTKLGHELIEDHAVEIIDNGPGQLTAPDTAHRRPVPSAPPIRKTRPIDGQPLARSERPAFTYDARSPVDDRAEHIERQRAHAADALE